MEQKKYQTNTNKRKKMRTFKQHIKEGHAGYSGDAYGVGTQGMEDSIEDSALGAHNVQDPDVLKRVNAFVSSIADKEYLKPQQAVDELKEKLGRIGLSFEATLEGDKGTITTEVTQFGGRFGKDTDGSDIDDDGISHKKEGGLKIEIKHETLQNGTSKVYAKLV